MDNQQAKVAGPARGREHRGRGVLGRQRRRRRRRPRSPGDRGAAPTAARRRPRPRRPSRATRANETLYTTGKQWGPPSTWNPLDPNAAMGVVGLQYETLFLYDPLADKFTPWLAESGDLDRPDDLHDQGPLGA